MAGYIDQIVGGGVVVEAEGSTLPKRAALNFTGDGATVTDAGDSIQVDIPAALALTTDTPQQLDGTAAVGTAAHAARADHKHTISLASRSASGAMSASDKARLDAISGQLTAAVATANNVTKSGHLTIDGVVTGDGDIVLLLGQTDPTEDGPWIVASGAWSAAPSVSPGGIVFVQGGALRGPWVLATASPPVFISQSFSYDVRLFGAIPDGVTDSGAAIAAALAALPSVGGKLFFPPGTGDYMSSVFFDCTSRQSVQFVGHATATGGAHSASVLTYTGTAAKFIDFGQSVGCGMRKLQVTYNNPSFTGVLVSLDGPDASHPTALFHIEHCRLQGALLTSAAALLSVENAYGITIDQTWFSGAVVGINGPHDPATTFCNTLTMRGGGFSLGSFTTGLVKNPGQQWTFTGSTFEGLVDGSANGIYCTSAGAIGVGIKGCWFGDITKASGQHILAYGVGWDIEGCYFGGKVAASAVTHVGSGPAITLAGTPTGDHAVEITISTGGALGTGAFTVTVDGGSPSAPITLPTGHTYTETNTGVVVTFPSGTYVVADTYSWTIQGTTAIAFNFGANHNVHNNTLAAHLNGVTFPDDGISVDAVNVIPNTYVGCLHNVVGAPISGHVDDGTGTQIHYASGRTFRVVQNRLIRLEVDSALRPRVPIAWPDGLSTSDYLIKPDQSATTVGNPVFLEGGRGAAGFRGGVALIGGGEADAGSGSPTHLAGDTNIQLGIPVSNASAALNLYAGTTVGDGSGRFLTINFNTGKAVWESTNAETVIAADTKLTLEAITGDTEVHAASGASLILGSSGELSGLYGVHVAQPTRAGQITTVDATDLASAIALANAAKAAFNALEAKVSKAGGGFGGTT